MMADRRSFFSRKVLSVSSVCSSWRKASGSKELDPTVKGLEFRVGITEQEVHMSKRSQNEDSFFAQDEPRADQYVIRLVTRSTLLASLSVIRKKKERYERRDSELLGFLATIATL